MWFIKQDGDWNNIFFPTSITNPLAFLAILQIHIILNKLANHFISLLIHTWLWYAYQLLNELKRRVCESLCD